MQNPNGFNSVPLLLSAVIAIRHHCYQIPASISLQSSAETCCTIFITPIDFYFTHSYIFTYLCEYTTPCEYTAIATQMLFPIASKGPPDHALFDSGGGVKC